MMGSTKRLAIAVTLTAVSGLAIGVACSDDVLDKDEKVCERPEEAEEIVDDDIIIRFEEEAGVPFHCGDSPPAIAGTYELTDREVIYTDSENWPDFSWFCSNIVTYEDTESPHRYKVSSESPDCDSTSEAQDSYITGEGDCFTLFRRNESSFEGCERETLSITSGCLDEDGNFIDYYGGGYTLHREDSDECDEVIGDGRIREAGELSVTQPPDGFVPRID